MLIKEKNRKKGTSSVPIAIAVVALLIGLSAIGVSLTRVPPVSKEHAHAVPEPADRLIYGLAVEYKGTAGEGEKIPNGTKVSAYWFEPSYIVVNKNDRVTLKIYGVNGGVHATVIDGYDDISYTVTDANGTKIEEGSGKLNVYRGHWTEAKFTASKTGIFHIICNNHAKTMHATLYVLG